MTTESKDHLWLFVSMVVVVLLGAFGLGSWAGSTAGSKAAQDQLEDYTVRSTQQTSELNAAIQSNSDGIADLNNKFDAAAPSKVLKELKELRGILEQHCREHE